MDRQPDPQRIAPIVRNEELGRKQPRVALKPRAAQNRSMLGASVYRALDSLINLISKDIEEALNGIDVVIQTLGVSLGDLFRPVSLFSDATRILVSAMESKGVKRLICVTGFGAGDSRESISCFQLVPFRLVFGRTYDDKSLQERLIKNSSLDWTIVRPGVLTSGRRTGRYKILDKRSQWRNGMISRSDVAEFLVRQIEDRTYVHKTPVLVY
jgi:putative NADH-flavin reductase